MENVAASGLRVTREWNGHESPGAIKTLSRNGSRSIFIIIRTSVTRGKNKRRRKYNEHEARRKKSTVDSVVETGQTNKYVARKETEDETS